eukprot:gene17629-6_t
MASIKIFLDVDDRSEVRRLRGEFTWTDLQCKLYKMWPRLFDGPEASSSDSVSTDENAARRLIRKLCIQYVDQDGDKVTVSSGTEWEECVRMNSETHQDGVLKLYIGMKAKKRVESKKRAVISESSMSEGTAAATSPSVVKYFPKNDSPTE